jgi:hypothetical protein
MRGDGQPTSSDDQPPPLVFAERVRRCSDGFVTALMKDGTIDLPGRIS